MIDKQNRSLHGLCGLCLNPLLPAGLLLWVIGGVVTVIVFHNYPDAPARILGISPAEFRELSMFVVSIFVITWIVLWMSKIDGDCHYAKDWSSLGAICWNVPGTCVSLPVLILVGAGLAIWKGTSIYLYAFIAFQMLFGLPSALVQICSCFLKTDAASEQIAIPDK